MPGKPWEPPEQPTSLDRVKRPDDAAPLELSGPPIVINPLESFSVSLPSLPIPCRLCGSDLRGKSARFVNPRAELGKDGEPLTVYSLACAACPPKEPAP